MRKTKIICTLGPAVDNEETIRQLILAGMDAARFNFSHGTHAEQLARLTMLKSVRDTLGRPVATILDTKGPEIRIKSFANGPITLEMEKYFQRMDPDNADNMKAQRVLELNPDSEAFAALKRAVAEDKDLAAKYAKLLYAQAQLIAGLPLADPAGYTELVCSLMK